MSAVPVQAQTIEESIVTSTTIQQNASAYEGLTLPQAAELKCDIDLCSHPANQLSFSNLMKLPKGTKIIASQIAAAWSRLMRTGYFRRVETQRIRNDDGQTAALTFVCSGHVIIQDLTVEYSSWGSWLYPKQFVAEITAWKTNSR